MYGLHCIDHDVYVVYICVQCFLWQVSCPTVTGQIVDLWNEICVCMYVCRSDILVVCSIAVNSYTVQMPMVYKGTWIWNMFLEHLSTKMTKNIYIFFSCVVLYLPSFISASMLEFSLSSLSFLYLIIFFHLLPIPLSHVLHSPLFASCHILFSFTFSVAFHLPQHPDQGSHAQTVCGPSR